jgi:hypothetical protein
MNDADMPETGHEAVVEELVEEGQGFIDGQLSQSQLVEGGCFGS